MISISMLTILKKIGVRCNVKKLSNLREGKHYTIDYSNLNVFEQPFYIIVKEGSSIEEAEFEFIYNYKNDIDILNSTKERIINYLESYESSINKDTSNIGADENMVLNEETDYILAFKKSLMDNGCWSIFTDEVIEPIFESARLNKENFKILYTNLEGDAGLNDIICKAAYMSTNRGEKYWEAFVKTRKEQLKSVLRENDMSFVEIIRSAGINLQN